MEASSSSSIQEKVLRSSIHHSSIPDHFVLIVPESGIFLAGQFHFQCLYGDLEVSGFTEKGGEYDPERFYYMAVHNMGNVPVLFKPYKTINFDEKLFNQRIRSVMESVTDNITESVRAYGDSIAVLLLNVKIDFKVSYLISRIGDMFRPSDKYRSIRISREAYIVYEQENKMKVWIQPEETINVTPLVPILDQVRIHVDQQQKIMLTGPKGVGKSTICRYLINRFIQLGRPLYLLDTDMGQAEMTPMGCFSITRITKPIFSLPFLHQPLHFGDGCLYMGTLSPGNNPAHFRQLMHYQVHRFIADAEPNAILMINTMGWIEQLGRQLNLELIETVKPTAILNLHGTTSFNLVDYRIPQFTNIFDYIPPSRANLKPSLQITPPQWRDLTMTGYLANVLDDERFGKPSVNRTLANVMARQVSFGNIGIYIHPERDRIAENLVLNVLNCSVVALCSMMYPGGEDGEANKLEVHRVNNNIDLPAILYPMNPENPPLLKCYGYGLIRSISPELKRYYLVTPLPDEICRKVDIFALGSKIQTPKYVYDKQDPDAPYLVRPRPGLQASAARNELTKKLFEGFTNHTALRASNRSRRQNSPGPSTKRFRTT
ncbi:unnamed protein product [Bursaphelenchus okinawaensis]|uniref:Clp1 P-loop domain-containing protein n=1 Tax=Bursaphelenchus okinawaensis TaxID=465554 RepID=A0A811JSA0_9BILA|nr:unnamed protein product [Bursaphelenchus okinawaensis]CAG9080663.1 unnamed protein product [Bursaphelenchus okinawaensis]